MKIKTIMFHDRELYENIKAKMLLKYTSPTYIFLKNEICKKYIRLGGKYSITNTTLKSPVYEVMSYSVKNGKIDKVNFKLTENKQDGILLESENCVVFKNSRGNLNKFNIDEVREFGLYAFGNNNA